MKRKELLGWLAIFALLTFFSSGRWALAPVPWIVPVIGLYIIHRTGARLGALLLLAASYLPLCLAWYGAAPFPMPIFPIFMLFNAGVGVLPYLFDRLLTPRLGDHFATSLVFPVAATAVEFVMMADGPLGSFGAQAYTQADFAPLAQFASVGGLWGITFIVSWCSGIAHWAVRRAEANKPYGRGVGAYALVLGAILIFGTVRLLTAPQPQASVAIAGLTTAPVDMGTMMRLQATDQPAFRERTRAQHAAYLAQTPEVVASGAQIILWPELAGLGMADDVAALVSAGQRLADQHNIYLAMPLMVFDATGGTAPVNKIVIADPQGAIVLEHVKYGGNILEGTQVGDKVLRTVETPFGTLSAVICWDTDYPSIIRQASSQGIDILLSPAYVWPQVAAMHADMAAFRSLENGMTIVRQSDNGFSQISDGYGRVVARENHIGQSNARLIAQAPLLTAPTLYATLGDGIGQLSAMGLLLLIFVGLGQWLWRGWQARQATAPRAA